MFQWPLGKLSDGIDRRFVIIAACAIMIANMGVLVLVAPGEGAGIRSDAGVTIQVVVFVAIFLLGGSSLTEFAICAAHAHDHAPEGQSVVVSSSILLGWSAGAIAGPFLCTSAMSAVGIHGMIYFIAACGIVLSIFIGFRIAGRKAVPVETRLGFMDLPITSLASAKLDLRGQIK